jgi:hypothetical protein
MKMQRTGGLLLFGALGLGAYFVLAPRFPKDQSVNVILGAAAPAVTEVSLRYTPEKDGTGEASRAATMRFDRGKAPRVVHHEARLPDGDYVVAIEVRADDVKTKETHVHLQGGSSTSINVEAAR